MTKEQVADSIGKRVVYTPFKGCDESDLEHGTITSVAPFSGDARVRYDGDNISKSTTPSDLMLHSDWLDANDDCDANGRPYAGYTVNNL